MVYRKCTVHDVKFTTMNEKKTIETTVETISCVVLNKKFFLVYLQETLDKSLTSI